MFFFIIIILRYILFSHLSIYENGRCLIIYVIFLKRTASMQLLEILINGYTLESKKHGRLRHTDEEINTNQ